MDYTDSIINAPDATVAHDIWLDVEGRQAEDVARQLMWDHWGVAV